MSTVADRYSPTLTVKSQLPAPAADTVASANGRFRNRSALDALCYERGIESTRPKCRSRSRTWRTGSSGSQHGRDARSPTSCASEEPPSGGTDRHKVPEWFSVEVLLHDPSEREVVEAA